VGEDRVAEAVPTLGGEDFAFFGRAGVPASFAFLGTRSEAAGAVHGLHTPQARLPGAPGLARSCGEAAGPEPAAGRTGAARSRRRMPACRLCGFLGWPAEGKQAGGSLLPLCFLRRGGSRWVHGGAYLGARGPA